MQDFEKKDEFGSSVRNIELRQLKNALSEATLEVERLRDRVAKKERFLKIAMLPWMVLFFPITILLFSMRYISNQKKQRNRLQKENSRKNSYVVIEASTMLKFKGIDITKKFLESNSASIAEGTVELFESAAATNDADWQKKINEFMAFRNEIQVRLEHGTLPRFFRIKFKEIPKVEAGPKVSVIMPCYNSEKTLRVAIGSILNQSWTNLELIAVDDRSSDKTWDILQDLAKSDNRLKILRLDANSGPYVAKNFGLKLVEGEYITGHDADDIATPNRIERQMAPMLNGSGALATIGYMIRLDERGCFSHPSRIGPFSFDGVVRKASISLCIKKEAIDELGYWDTVRFGADSEMIGRVTGLLGKKLVFQKDLTMLCLDADANLTNDPKTGLRLSTGVSPVRIDYRDTWRAWHKATPIEQRKLPFPHVGQDRKFAIPEAMMVSDEAVDAIKTQVVLGDKLGKSD